MMTDVNDDRFSPVMVNFFGAGIIVDCFKVYGTSQIKELLKMGPNAQHSL